VGRKNPLAALYFFRALALAALALSSGELIVYLAAAVVGITYISPGPLASALLADRYGSLSVGTLYGMAILSHQVGGALGAYLGGHIFDATGSYHWAFVSAALLTFIAAGSAFSIREARAKPTS
jgi:predicted MFS family arabinose efflux permease